MLVNRGSGYGQALLISIQFFSSTPHVRYSLLDLDSTLAILRKESFAHFSVQRGCPFNAKQFENSAQCFQHFHPGKTWEGQYN